MPFTLSDVIGRGAASMMLVASTVTCASEYSKNVDATWKPGTAQHVVSVSSSPRTFLVHVPPGRSRNRFGVPISYPLVVLLHGSGADGETIRRQSRIEPLADSLRFAVAYPNATSGVLGFGSDWNAGTCCGLAAREHVDDVAFIRAVIAATEGGIQIDRRRIFIAGFSDGARMAYRLACEEANMIAAVGIVSGSLMHEQCMPARPVPVIAFHGTSDTEVPYADSALTAARVPATPASSGLPPAVRFWSAVDGCKGVAVRREAPHVTRASFGPCSGADVVLYTIEDGLHAWPGGEKDGGNGALPTGEIRATDAMMRFFYRHPLP